MNDEPKWQYSRLALSSRATDDLVIETDCIKNVTVFALIRFAVFPRHETSAQRGDRELKSFIGRALGLQYLDQRHCPIQAFYQSWAMELIHAGHAKSGTNWCAARNCRIKLSKIVSIFEFHCELGAVSRMESFGQFQLMTILAGRFQKRISKFFECWGQFSITRFVNLFYDPAFPFCADQPQETQTCNNGPNGLATLNESSITKTSNDWNKTADYQQNAQQNSISKVCSGSLFSPRLGQKSQVVDRAVAMLERCAA